MLQYGELRPTSSWDLFVSLVHPQQISTGFASWLRYCSDVTQWKPTKLHDVWPSPGLVHYIHFRGFLPRNGILPGAKFTLRPSLVLSYVGSVTARHSSSGRQPNCGVQQRAPPIFGMAAMTLGIGPHSSLTRVAHNYMIEVSCHVRQYYSELTTAV